MQIHDSRAWNRHFGFGIIARLAIIFLCVGGLVLATSFIVGRSVLVVRTTHTIHTLPAPVPMASPTVAPRTTPIAVETELLNSEDLLLAVNRFEGAVQARVREKTAVTEAAFQQSSATLTRIAKGYLNDAAALSARVRGLSSTVLNEHLPLGQSLVSTADDRRDLLKQYAVLLDGLKMRDQASLDKAWRIFGRVVTRQSLIQLDADLDTLVRNYGALDVTDEGQAAAMAALLGAEATVQKDLDENKAALIRSQGSAWYAGMHDDFAALLRVREAVAEANEHQAAGTQEFSQQADAFARFVPPRSETRTARPQRPAAAAPVVSPAPVVPPATVVETSESTSPVEQPDAPRDYLVGLCAVAVALLTYVAVGTAISIIVPVRRLVRATAELAQGNVTVRMPRGGLKELDNVAVAFNQMAEELAIARQGTLDYQQRLERQVAERTRQLEVLAKHDPLTSLPNRRDLFILLNDALSRADAEHERLAVFFLDIDNFKYINDSMGHAFGDRVIVAIAERLLEATRSIGFCARLGGDEFTVVFEQAPSSEAIREAGIRIVKAFQTPLTIDARDLIVSVSVGASIYPEHDQHAEGLLKAADAALFRAKTLGRSQLSVFTPDLLEAAAGKFSLEQGLRRGLERGEFELLFQPEIQAASFKTTIVEALLRWHTPDGRLLAPGEFLAIAEETGLIMEIGDWVMRSAIEAAAHWHHGEWPDVCVAINVSPRQLIDIDFVDRVVGLLKEHRLPPQCIEIELTETVLQTGPATTDALKRLRSHGVSIALDDFGTGYSSLASLERLPLTRIKLDRSLISEIDRSPRAAAIANAIIGLCQGLGLDITAEGVERPEQFAMLAAHRGMHLQGYLLAHPTARDEVLALLDIVAQRARKLVLEAPDSVATRRLIAS